MSKAYLILFVVAISFTADATISPPIDPFSTTKPRSSGYFSRGTTIPPFSPFPSHTTSPGSKTQCIAGQTYCTGSDLCCYSDSSFHCYVPDLRQGNKLTENLACFPNEVRFACSEIQPTNCHQIPYFIDFVIDGEDGQQCCQDYYGVYQPTPKQIWSPYRECSHSTNKCRPSTLCRTRFDPVYSTNCAYSFTFSPECKSTTFKNPFASLCYSANSGQTPVYQSAFDRNYTVGQFNPEDGNSPFLATVDCADGPENAWLLIHKRFNGAVNFSRNWDEYENGFGDPNGEFWLGLKAIRNFTKNENYEIRVDVRHLNRTQYTTARPFYISGADNNYQLHVGYDFGNYVVYNNGAYFSTRDRVNTYSGVNCGEQQSSGWWFRYWNGNCGYTNPNGKYFADGRSPVNQTQLGLYWSYSFGYPPLNNWYSLTAAEIKIRRIK